MRERLGRQFELLCRPPLQITHNVSVPHSGQQKQNTQRITIDKFCNQCGFQPVVEGIPGGPQQNDGRVAGHQMDPYRSVKLKTKPFVLILRFQE